MPTAVITGAGGQDGWYLARNLLARGYQVIGTTHRAYADNTLAVGDHAILLVHVDMTDTASIDAVVRTHKPDELYNLGCRSSSAQLFDDPLATADVNGVAVVRFLEAIRRDSPATKFCQASSAEVFQGATTSPQDETTAKAPLNAYGAAKAFADHMIAAYRTRGVFACSAILYPHESPRRPPHYLVRKVARAAARIAAGRDKQVVVGDLTAVRDWGYAPDYVEAMRLMLQAQAPSDYIIASGEAHTVADACEAAFSHIGLDWKQHVVVDDQFKRAAETVRRIGNPARARAELGWHPSLTFAQMIGELVDSDRAALD